MAPILSVVPGTASVVPLIAPGFRIESSNCVDHDFFLRSLRVQSKVNVSLQPNWYLSPFGRSCGGLKMAGDERRETGEESKGRPFCYASLLCFSGFFCFWKCYVRLAMMQMFLSDLLLCLSSYPRLVFPHQLLSNH